MKRIPSLLIAILMVISVNAQDSEIQTLFGGGTRISGMGGPIMSFSSIDGQLAHMMGGGGGVILGDLFVGGYGLGLTNPITSGGNTTEFGHGGLWAGYSFMGKAALHPVVSSQLGWGTVTQLDEYIVLSSDNIFVLNPAIELEMNFTRFFRLGIGAHYRLVRGVNTSTLTDSDFSGPGAFLSFKFGWF
jgi:hypothetical protein